MRKLTPQGESIMKRIQYVSLFLLLILCTGFGQAQQKNTGSSITVKDDEVSGKRSVELEVQRISSTLAMSITAEIDTRTKGEPPLRDFGTATVNFVSTTSRREYGAADTEFNFLVDGERVKGGSVSSSPLTDKRAKDGKELAHGVMSNGALQDIGRGRDVKMKIGEQVFTLDKSVIENIAAVFRELIK
jgi:hypothetical protein